MSGGFLNWLQTGVLTNINQIGLELHVRHIDRDQRLDFFFLKVKYRQIILQKILQTVSQPSKSSPEDVLLGLQNNLPGS